MTSKQFEAYYSGLQQASIDAVRKLVSDEVLHRSIIKLYSQMDDQKNLSNFIPEGHSDLLRTEAFIDLERSLFFAVNGSLVSAFIHLRMHLEKYLAYIDYSGNERAYRLWQAGDRDIVWNMLIDEDSGVFSSSSCRAYESGLDNERRHYAKLAKEVYRECSQFVHGNFSSILAVKNVIHFDEVGFKSYVSKAEIVLDVSLFAWCVRYIGCEYCSKADLSEILLDRMGHIPAVQARIGS